MNEIDHKKNSLPHSSPGGADHGSPINLDNTIVPADINDLAVQTRPRCALFPASPTNLLARFHSGPSVVDIIDAISSRPPEEALSLMQNLSSFRRIDV